jgi:glycosyltransferase involved in cell wall biosynthesis
VTAGSAAAAAPGVAVIIAVYNGERFLAETLRSVFTQTLQPAEVIVVDDGSTDRSLSVVAASGFADRVTVLRSANGRQSAARNTGLASATSELVAFLDQDDVWHPRHLEELVACLAAQPHLGWCYSDFDEIDDDGRLVLQRFHRAHGLRHPKTSLAELLGEDIMALPSAALVRAAALADVGGFDEQLCGYEDDDLFIRLFRRHWLGGYVQHATVQFRVHDYSSSASAEFGESRLKFLKKLAADVPNNRRLNRYYIRDILAPRLLYSTINEYLTSLAHGENDRARVLAGLATRIAPYSRVTARQRAGLWLLRRPALCRHFTRAAALMPRGIRRRVLGSWADRPDLGLRQPSSGS